MPWVSQRSRAEPTCHSLFFFPSACGTDCVVYGGMGTLPNGQCHSTMVYLFREQNVVCKFQYSKRGLRKAAKQVQENLFNETRALAYSHAMVSRLLVEQNPFVAPAERKSFWSWLAPRS